MTAKNVLPWQDKALSLIALKLHEDVSRITGEEIRFWLASKRLRAPAHPNAYGALIRRAIDLGLLRPTSKLVPNRSPTSHGRARRDYTVVRPRPVDVFA